MDEQNKMIEEIKSAKDEELRSTIEKWFEQTRNQGMKIGASYISAAVAGAIQKHLKKGKDASLRDYKRMADDIWKIVSVQLTKQNDSNTENETNEQESSI